MAIDYKYITSEGKIQKHTGAACFGSAAEGFDTKKSCVASPDSANIAVNIIEYSPDIDKAIKGTSIIKYDPAAFLHDIVASPGPIKTALDIIDSFNGPKCINLDNMSVAVTSRLQYKLALFVLSLVRLTEEQPKFVDTYNKVRPKCSSVTQAFLWAYWRNPQRGSYSGHDVLISSKLSAIMRSEKGVTVALNTGRADYVYYILGPEYNFKLEWPVNNSKISLLRMAESLEYFIGAQNKVLSCLKEQKYDLDDYTTA